MRWVQDGFHVDLGEILGRICRKLWLSEVVLNAAKRCSKRAFRFARQERRINLHALCSGSLLMLLPVLLRSLSSSLLPALCPYDPPPHIADSTRN